VKEFGKLVNICQSNEWSVFLTQYKIITDRGLCTAPNVTISRKIRCYCHTHNDIWQSKTILLIVIVIIILLWHTALNNT